MLRADALNIAVEDSASHEDAEWFAAKPERGYRLRPRQPGELGQGEDTHVIVIQICPGIRSRQTLHIAGALPNDDDAQLGRLAELTLLNEAAFIVNGHVLSLEEFPVWGVQQ